MNRSTIRRPVVVYGITMGGSAATLLSGQLGWLRAKGWDVHLATTCDEGAFLAAEREGVTLHCIPMQRTIAPWSDFTALVKWIWLLRTVKPDVVNVGTPKAALLGMLAASLCRVPRRVYVLRGLRLEGATGPTRALLVILEALIMRAATEVIVVSASLGAEARRRKLLPRRGAWLIGEGSSNGVSLEVGPSTTTPSAALALRSKMGIAATDFVVGYVGRITTDKGVHYLVRAIGAYCQDPNVRLLLVGSVDDGSIVHLIRSLGKQAVHVPWTGRVQQYYAVMDVLCLPTLREGFPNVVLEAAAVGVPSITTTATGAIDSVKHGQTGLLIPTRDAPAIGRAIMQLATAPGLVHQLGAEARKRAHDSFKPQDVWSGIESILVGTPAKHVRRI